MAGTTRLFCVLCICFILTWMTVIGNEMGYCPESQMMTFETECISCHINVFTDCPSGSKKLTGMEGTSNCTYEMHLGPGPNITKDGCTHTCETNVTIDQCCRGFWGPKCDECPGGFSKACSGHGVCSDRMNGTGQCTCEDGRTGYACQFCSNSSMGGENCTQAMPKDLCKDVICPNNSKCLVIDGEAICMCNNSSDNTTKVCKEIDACLEAPLCHANASCVLSNTTDVTGLGKNCSCNSGYQGDGYQCDPIDPCQVNNGGCHVETSACNYVGPGKSECVCKEGYENHVLDSGCSLIDVCAENASACHEKATCETVFPLQMSCICNDGYEGNGHICYTDILQTIKDLNTDDPILKGQMSLIQGAIEKYYKTELTQHAFFTMFVSTNEGFRTINTADYQKWLNDKIKVRQILRQHIVVGWHNTDKLLNHTAFHTLQGTPAELMVNYRGDQLKFRLRGSSKKAKIVKGNVLASNGVIHIINKLLTNAPDNYGSEEKTILDTIKRDGKYNRFETLVETAGDEVKNILISQKVTALVPNNAAFDSLPVGALDFLTSNKGKGHLITLLKNHILPNITEVTDLIDKRRLSSLAGIYSWLSVTFTGQIQLNNGINLTQSDIAASNGLIHDIDGVLLSDDISILPNNCDLTSYKEVMGPCDDCRVDARCYYGDDSLNTTVECRYFSKNAENRYVKVSGCALMCNRTYKTPKCCDGFYGFDCLPCPGGHENACNGRGKRQYILNGKQLGSRPDATPVLFQAVCKKLFRIAFTSPRCNDGYFGDGTCTCDGNYGGDACDTCADNRHFGPNCTQECTCLQDRCNSGPTGNGKCKYPCFPPMKGDNCDIQATVCNFDLHHCHAHAMCIWIQKDYKFRCICKPGYSGSGLSCKEIDPCKESYRGGCHLQATCEKTGPGTANCTCNEGWQGDGKNCHLETTCGNHADCHRYAECLPSTPGKHICMCKDDFVGNGTYCLYKNRCEVNNGGCHSMAKCSHDDRSEIYVNCTCSIEMGYSGNGYSCHGNIVMEIEKHPKLTKVANTLRELKEWDLELFLDNNYTMFVVSDEGLRNFSMKHKIEHWMRPDNVIQLMNYHTILGSYTLDKLVAISDIKKLQTMADGFSLYITRSEEGTVHLFPQKTGNIATVLESNIIASNGYINVIDKVLEPYQALLPEDYPDLDTFFGNHPEYSIFAGWLKDKNLTDKLENVMDSYTLFIPNNEAAKTINRTVTTDFLRYYILPSTKMMTSLNNDQVVTDLGINHQLITSIRGWNNYTVNDVQVLKVDMFTYGGIVNEINGLLHPVLHKCDEKNTSVDFGPCTMCLPGSIYPCIGDATAVADKGPFDCVYTEYVGAHIYRKLPKKKGCQGLCLIQTMIKGCCSGYYGKDCQECPGGPEFPCNGHGTCNDGIYNDGTCKCDPKFKGELCDTCIEGWAGDNCDIDKTSCRYRNGGCHQNADCNKGSKITCTCWDGFHGDGYNCTGPCDENNGGCHRNATCQYLNKYYKRCDCKDGLVGDGKTNCMKDILSSLVYLDQTTWFRKSLLKISNKTLLSNLKSSYSTDQFTLFVPIDKGLQMKNIDGKGNQRDIIVTRLVTDPIQDKLFCGKQYQDSFFGLAQIWFSTELYILYRTLPESSLLQQIVVLKSARQLTDLSPIDFNNITMTTLSDQVVTITYNTAVQSFFVNGTKIISGNIRFTNGLVHIVEKPFTPPSLSESESSGSSSVGAILGPLAALIIVAIVVVVAVIVYRRSQLGYWQVLQSWISKRRDSEVANQERPLHVDDDDNVSRASISGLPHTDASFGNPMYQSNDL